MRHGSMTEEQCRRRRWTRLLWWLQSRWTKPREMTLSLTDIQVGVQCGRALLSGDAK
jgi:hypothetical protein